MSDVMKGWWALGGGHLHLVLRVVASPTAADTLGPKERAHSLK